MPIYEFVCQDCGNEFEKIQSFSETRMPDCLACKGSNVLRKMSRPAIHFKGSGWYITDSKSGSNGASSKEGAKEKGGEAAEKAEKTETAEKPEAKASPAKTSQPSAEKD